MSDLRLEGVGKRYGTVTALDDVSLEVRSGSRTAVVGPSGSGKTTLLRLVAGFEMPDAGRIFLGGQALADGPSGVPAHRRGVGYVAQDGALFPHLTVARNIGFGLQRGPDRARRIAALMEAVELDRGMADRRPHQLSGGQQQRVALARALARRPRLMLLDEPFSALDTSLREAVRRMVARVLGEAGVTAILVTHDQAEALSFADQVVVLDRGRLLQAGSPRQLYLEPRDRVTATFLGDLVVLPAALGDGVADCALGRIPADTGGRRGPAMIMLRPEQIRLAPILGGNGQACRIQAVEFAGPVSMVALSVGGLPDPLRIRMSSADLPPTGAPVEIVILGRAHILP